MKSGSSRIYLGKVVGHETRGGPTTKDPLRAHEFGTGLIFYDLDNYRNERRK